MNNLTVSSTRGADDSAADDSGADDSGADDSAWRLWTPPITALATIAAGLCSAFFYHYRFGDIASPSSGWMVNAFETTLTVVTATAPGYLFALAFLLTAKGRNRVPIWAGALFILLAMVAYIVARGAAISPRQFVSPVITSVPAILQGIQPGNLRGMLAGGVGATILAIGFIPIYRIREWKRIVAILLLVPITGILTGYQFLEFPSPYLAFPLWQGGVGFMMALLNPGAWIREGEGINAPGAKGAEAKGAEAKGAEAKGAEAKAVPVPEMEFSRRSDPRAGQRPPIML